MEIIYARFRKRARQIVSRYPSPDFYQDHSFANELSRHYFETNFLTAELREFVAEQLEENFGHGLEHAIKVAIDAGALMIVENKLAEQTDNRIIRRIVVVQCAGLLHDIKRRQENHAIKGSDHARKVLKPYPFDPGEVDDICRAIRNHEAFKPTVKSDTVEGALVSDCLYDADKFRWGPDNFTDTVWAMVSYFNIPVVEFMDLYPEGMEKLAKIKYTFRTRTGKKYGPQFIDLGVAIGKELFNVINKELAHLL
jgi:hypothetical protein